MTMQTQIVRPFGQGELPLYGYGKGIVVEPEPGKRIVKIGAHPLLYPLMKVGAANPDDFGRKAAIESFAHEVDCGNELVAKTTSCFLVHRADNWYNRLFENMAQRGREGRIMPEIIFNGTGMDIVQTDPLVYNYKHPRLATAEEIEQGKVRGGFHWFTLNTLGEHRLFFGGQSLKFGKVDGLGNILKEALIGTKYEKGEIAGV
jgi:hypothetical protein